MHIHGVKGEEVMGYESGAYAKETCTIGSDLDLNVAYDEAQFGTFHAFEKNLIRLSSFMLQIYATSIHSNDLNAATRLLVSNKMLPAGLREKRRILRRLILGVTRPFVERRIYRIGRIEFLNYLSWAAIRDPKMISIGGIESLNNLYEGGPRYGAFLDKVFIFGNGAIYDAALEAIMNEIDIGKAKIALPDILGNIFMKRFKTTSPDDLNECYVLAKKFGGYEIGFRLLFILGLAKTTCPNAIPRTYGEFLAPENQKNIIEILGEEARNQLFQSLDWLLKCRAIISIFANGGIEMPSIRFAQFNPDFGQETLERVLETLGLDNFKALKEAVRENRDVIKMSIEKARMVLV